MHLSLLMARVGIIKQKNRACFKCVYSANSERGEAATFSSTKYDSMVKVVTKAMEFMFEKMKTSRVSRNVEKLRNFLLKGFCDITATQVASMDVCQVPVKQRPFSMAEKNS